MPYGGPGSLDHLPLGPSTEGSLGLDSHFLGSGSVELRVNERGRERDGLIRNKSMTMMSRQGNVSLPNLVKRTPVIVAEDEDSDQEDYDEYEDEEDAEIMGRLQTRMGGLGIDSMHSATTPTSAGWGQNEERMASGVPSRPVKTGMPTYLASRGLSASSLKLKKKQAAELEAAAIKAMAVEIPETESIASRIKMFGGANAAATRSGGGLRRLGVRDMVQRFQDAEDLILKEEIRHVSKGNGSCSGGISPGGMGGGGSAGALGATSPAGAGGASPAGVGAGVGVGGGGGGAGAYALRPRNGLRPTQKGGKALWDTNEEPEQAAAAPAGRPAGRYARGGREEEAGVNQESIQSVRNAKSMFETLARAGGEGAQM